MENWTALKIERQKYKRMLRDVKTQTICEKVADCSQDAKKLYSLMSYLTGTKVDNPMPQHTDEDQLADEFADFFVGKIKTIHESLAEHPIYNPHGPRKASLNQFRSVSQDDVECVIRGMPTKSCESDAIPTSLLKEILPAVTPSLAKIINISVEHGIFAAAWKIAIIRPLLKKVELDLISSNYRLVSNSGTILEQFITYCDTHKLIPDYQSAYRKNFSCETSIIKVVNDVLWNFENQEVCVMCMEGLSTAFDTVDHPILLQVLQSRFGVSGSALARFELYLQPSFFKAKVGTIFSTIRSLDCSVSQESLAGPNPYSASASTLQEDVPDDVGLNGFADDHSLKRSFKADERKAKQTVISALQNCLMNVRTWMDENRLKMNDGKTEFIMFGAKKQLAKCKTTSIDVNKTVVNNSEVVKYLGTWMDCNLTFKDHIGKKCRTAMIN